MENRTTIGVDERHRNDARDVKENHGEDWNDVLAFYAAHRDELADSDTVATAADIERLADLVENVPEQTAAELQDPRHA